jgi:hypothetical protein
MVDARHGSEINAIEHAYTQAMSDLSANRIEYMVLDCEYLRSLTLTDKGQLERLFQKSAR